MEIFSKHQQTYLKAKAFEKGVDLHWWIGLTDKIRNDQPTETFSQSNSTRWFWSHSLISANYTNWHHTEPNGGLNDIYVLMASGSTYDYEWVDAKAVTKEYPICQFYP